MTRIGINKILKSFSCPGDCKELSNEFKTDKKRIQQYYTYQGLILKPQKKAEKVQMDTKETHSSTMTMMWAWLSLSTDVGVV